MIEIDLHGVSISKTYTYIKLIVLTSQQILKLMRSTYQKFWAKNTNGTSLKPSICPGSRNNRRGGVLTGSIKDVRGGSYAP
jgi:hypothetical protein